MRHEGSALRAGHGTARQGTATRTDAAVAAADDLVQASDARSPEWVVGGVQVDSGALPG